MKFDHATDHIDRIHIAAETLRMRFGREASWTDHDPGPFQVRSCSEEDLPASVFVMKQH